MRPRAVPAPRSEFPAGLRDEDEPEFEPGAGPHLEWCAGRRADRVRRGMPLRDAWGLTVGERMAACRPKEGER